MQNCYLFTFCFYQVDDVDPDDFGAVLEFVYTGTIDINDGNVTKFKEMAEKLKLPKLEDACEVNTTLK